MLANIEVLSKKPCELLARLRASCAAFLHGSSSHLPVWAGSPPQCQPAFNTPTPGLERITCPSSLTTPVPMATNEPMSWSNEYISVTALGLSPSTLGSVIAAGGLKIAPDGWIVTMNRGCWPKPGIIGTLSPCTTVTVTQPSFDPPGNVTWPGLNDSEKPGA